MVQIATATAVPVVHLVELIDWATGGPAPSQLGDRPVETTVGDAKDRKDHVKIVQSA
jgi:hypothetical protein